MGFVDIGNGNIIFVPDPPPKVDHFKELETMLHITDLTQKIQAAPTERKLKEAELKIKEEQINNFDINRKKLIDEQKTAHIGLIKQQGELVNSVFDNLDNGNDLSAALIMKELGGTIVQDQKGNSTLNFTMGGGASGFSLPYQKGVIRDQKLRLEWEDKLNKRWMNDGQAYKKVLSYYKNVKNGLSHKNPQSDLFSIVAMAKLIDENSVAREGEVVTIKNTQNLPDWLTAELNRLKDKPNSGLMLQKMRDRIGAYADDVVKARKELVQQQAEQLAELGQRKGLSPQNFLPNIGEDDLRVGWDVIDPGRKPGEEEPTEPPPVDDKKKEPPSNMKRFENVLKERLGFK